MSDLLELLVSASASGCIYGLVALAYLLVLRPTGIVNFAVGEWAMIGAFAAYLLSAGLGLPSILVIPGAALLMAILGWATEWSVVRPLVVRGAGHLAPILVLLGMLVIYHQIMLWRFGADQFPLEGPFGFRRVELGPIAGTPQSFFIIVTTLAVFGAVWLFFERTVWGKSFEAVAINRRAAALMGINLRMVTALAFAGGAAIAGIAGLLDAPRGSLEVNMALPLAIQGFSALVIGGVNRVEGALLGGIILAFAEDLTRRYVPIPSGLSLGVTPLLLIIFLMVRPNGLLRAREAG
ncbi:MAG: branched-chain amino acid ABC transporter permease [Alphaproteobacteria bacterium]|nr:branched-chain amino acid ABC transporter permease [Alphaproteobacteria bacterium]